MSDVATVRRLMAEAERLKLEGVELLRGLTLEEIAKEYNGIGPAWFSERIRKVLDDAFDLFQAPAMVHDVDYRFADGSTRMFHEANERLRRNCRTAAKDRYGWYDPRRYHYLKRADQLAAACEIFGWTAYTSACCKK